MKTNRWQDWINLMLGAWLFASPWLMNYADVLPNAAGNAWALGAAIVLLAAVAMYMPMAWEEGVNILLGAWVAISPWVLGFTSNEEVTTNAVVVGSLVTVLAIWAMLQDPEFRKHWHKDKRTV